VFTPIAFFPIVTVITIKHRGSLPPQLVILVVALICSLKSCGGAVGEFFWFEGASVVFEDEGVSGGNTKKLLVVMRECCFLRN
jgi:hypothetical protein